MVVIMNYKEDIDCIKFLMESVIKLRTIEKQSCHNTQGPSHKVPQHFQSILHQFCVF